MTIFNSNPNNGLSKNSSPSGWGTAIGILLFGGIASIYFRFILIVLVAIGGGIVGNEIEYWIPELRRKLSNNRKEEQVPRSIREATITFNSSNFDPDAYCLHHTECSAETEFPRKDISNYGCQQENKGSEKNGNDPDENTGRENEEVVGELMDILEELRTTRRRLENYYEVREEISNEFNGMEEGFLKKAEESQTQAVDSLYLREKEKAGSTFSRLKDIYEFELKTGSQEISSKSQILDLSDLDGVPEGLVKEIYDCTLKVDETIEKFRRTRLAESTSMEMEDLSENVDTGLDEKNNNST